MDQRLKDALDFSQFRTTQQIQKANLKNKAENLLLVSFQNGLFKADQQLIGFVSALINRGVESYVFLDLNEVPYQIENLQEFFDELLSANKRAMNDWYFGFNQLKNSRNVAKIVGVDIDQQD